MIGIYITFCFGIVLTILYLTSTNKQGYVRIVEQDYGTHQLYFLQTKNLLGFWCDVTGGYSESIIYYNTYEEALDELNTIINTKNKKTVLYTHRS